MTKWDRYLAKKVDGDGRHKEFTGWRVIGVWGFERDDGHTTAHKFDMPFAFWETTAEESMRLVDKYVPINQEFLPDGVQSISDLWKMDEAERKQAAW